MCETCSLSDRLLEMIAVVTGKRVYLDSSYSEPIAATITVDLQTGKITSIQKGVYLTSAPSGVPLDCFHDAVDLVVMPAVVDTHVHVNEPGRTQWEGFETATKAAAAGGCCTIVDMPLNSIPPTTTLENLKTKVHEARSQCYVDVGFYGGVIPGNCKQLKSMVQAGVKGFKCFMIESGVDEFPCVSEQDIRQALQELQGNDSFLMFHAEVECSHSKKSIVGSDYAAFLDSRPKQMENEAISLVIKLCEEYQVPCHIVHLSSADALPLIRKAKDKGIPITVETCFHYLCLSSEKVPEGNTAYKCCPPIRDESNRELLWKGLKDGTIDFVVSDHSPCTADLKLLDKGDFMKAWGGIASVQFGLQLLWTEGTKRGVSISQIIKWLCENTAKRVRLDREKGNLAVGYYGDIVIWNDHSPFTVNEKNIHFRNKVTPYAGKTFEAEIVKTILRGKVVFSNGSISTKPYGTLLIDL